MRRVELRRHERGEPVRGEVRESNSAGMKKAAASKAAADS